MVKINDFRCADYTVWTPTVAVFQDLYGNKWDLLGPHQGQEGKTRQPG
jgi:hypothetical protein